MPGVRRTWAKAVLLVAAVGAATGVAWYAGLEDLLSRQRVVEFLDGAGPWGPALYVVLMVLAVVISPIPSIPLDLAAGVVFGPFLGGVLSVLGAEIGALISFLLARRLGREAVARLLGDHLAFCDRCARRQLTGVIFAARLLPIVSFDLVSYGAGLTAIPLRNFALATLLGMIPPTFALTYLGSSVLVGSAWAWVLGAVLVLAFFLVPVWIRKQNPMGLYDLIGSEERPREGGSV
ncbi:MAG: TVP38/TMEM64 family protein [Deferrisomatales bacterium]|nr:TVP38/TMEM64 family protein [Deferrisomatales bacterium]